MSYSFSQWLPCTVMTKLSVSAVKEISGIQLNVFLQVYKCPMYWYMLTHLKMCSLISIMYWETRRLF